MSFQVFTLWYKGDNLVMVIFYQLAVFGHWTQECDDEQTFWDPHVTIRYLSSAGHPTEIISGLVS